MTHLENLTMRPQHAVEKYGESARSAQELGRQTNKVEQSKLPLQAPEMLQSQSGL